MALEHLYQQLMTMKQALPPPGKVQPKQRQMQSPARAQARAHQGMREHLQRMMAKGARNG